MQNDRKAWLTLERSEASHVQGLDLLYEGLQSGPGTKISSANWKTCCSNARSIAAILSRGVFVRFDQALKTQQMDHEFVQNPRICRAFRQGHKPLLSQFPDIMSRYL